MGIVNAYNMFVEAEAEQLGQAVHFISKSMAPH